MESKVLVVCLTQDNIEFSFLCETFISSNVVNDCYMRRLLVTTDKYIYFSIASNESPILLNRLNKYMYTDENLNNYGVP